MRKTPTQADYLKVFRWDIKWAKHGSLIFTMAKPNPTHPSSHHGYNITYITFPSTLQMEIWRTTTKCTPNAPPTIPHNSPQFRAARRTRDLVANALNRRHSFNPRRLLAESRDPGFTKRPPIAQERRMPAPHTPPMSKRAEGALAL